MGYGAIGNASFRYYRLDIAEGITLTGQLALRYVSSKVDEYLNGKTNMNDHIFAIYGDTDSIYVSIEKYIQQVMTDITNTNKVIDTMDDFVNKDLSPFICDQNIDLSNFLGANKNMLIMKREALADTALFRGKKNYIIQVYDNEFVRYQTPKLKMMGVETAKTSTARIVRDKLSECLKIVVNDEIHKSTDLKDIVDNFRKEFNSVDVMRIASPRGVKDIDKWTDNYGNILSGCPIHVRASINYNRFVNSTPEMKRKYDVIRNGDKIKFVKLKQPNHYHTHVIAFLEDEIPPEMELGQFVDRKTQFEDTFMSPLESFTKLVGWDIRRTVSMNDLFDAVEEQQIQSTDTKKKKKDKVVIKNNNTIDDLF